MTDEAIKTLNDILNSRVNNNGQYNPIADHQLMYRFGKEISKIPEFEIFSEKTQRLGNQSCAVRIVELLSWLVERSQAVGAEQAIQDALGYSKATEIEVYDLILLDSTYIENREFRFCNGVTIAMLDEIPNHRFASELNRSAFSGVAPGASVVSILYVSNSQPVSHPSSALIEESQGNSSATAQKLMIWRTYFSV